MDCQKELGCSDAERLTKLSGYLDGELAASEAAILEEHLKSCERCRNDLAGLRGADRAFAKAIETGGPVGPGFVTRVMSTILGRNRSDSRAHPAARPLLWAIIAAAVAGIGSLVIFAIVERDGTEHRPIGLSVVERTDTDGLQALWRVRRPGGKVAREVALGTALATGTELELAPGTAHGLIRRSDGLAIYVEAGSVLRIRPEADDEHGIALVSGRLFVDARESSRPFEIGLGEAAIAKVSGRDVTALLEVSGTSYGICVLSGHVQVSAQPFEDLVGPGGRIYCDAGPRRFDPRFDVRGLELGFAPARLRPSPWPMEGGSYVRSGRSPFAAFVPPQLLVSLEGVAGASGAVLAPDGAAFFLVGPPPGRLVRFDGKAESVPLESAFVGEPAVGPDGRVYISTRDGVFSSSLPGEPLQLKRVFSLEEGDVARAGPLPTFDGSIALVSSKGLTLYGPDGSVRWRASGVMASSSPAEGPGGRICVVTLSGRIHVFDHKSGRDLAAGLPPVDEAFLARPCVGPDGTVYAVTARRYLVEIPPDLSVGRRLAMPEFEYSLPPAIDSSGRLYVASNAGLVWRLEKTDREVPKTPFYESGERFTQGPLIDGADTVLLWTASGRLVAIEPSGRARVHDLGARDAAPAAIGRDGSVFFVTRDGRIFGGGRPTR